MGRYVVPTGLLLIAPVSGNVFGRRSEVLAKSRHIAAFFGNKLFRSATVTWLLIPRKRVGAYAWIATALICRNMHVLAENVWMGSEGKHPENVSRVQEKKENILAPLGKLGKQFSDLDRSVYVPRAVGLA